jgi:hypothetical protein
VRGRVRVGAELGRLAGGVPALHAGCHFYLTSTWESRITAILEKSGVFGVRLLVAFNALLKNVR